MTIIALSACGGQAVEPVTAAGGTASSQAEQGAALYGDYCASCHGADGSGSDDGPAVVGVGALPLRAADGAKRQATFATAGDVFRWVRVSMPGDDPGSLDDEEYAAILAFALQANGVDVGATHIDEAAADAIRLH